MPGRIELKPTLVKIWHAADHFRLMDPLPSMHRRGDYLRRRAGDRRDPAAVR